MTTAVIRLRPLACWAACLLLAGCATPATTPEAPPVEVAARALETDVGLGLGERDFTMTITRDACTSPNGDCPAPTVEKIRCRNFAYEVKSPRDAASGQATGKRQHAPIRIVKEWDAATPLLLKALVDNETFKTVKLEFSRNNGGSSRLSVATTITLTDVSVVGISHAVGSDGGDDDGDGFASPRELEEVSLVCGSVTISDGKTSAEDSWLESR